MAPLLRLVPLLEQFDWARTRLRDCLAGAGEWGRDSAPLPHLWPPPFTTIAWRLGHLSEMLALRADHMIGSHTLTRDDYRSWMTTATVTFSAIGQPEHITVAPGRDSLSQAGPADEPPPLTGPPGPVRPRCCGPQQSP